MHRTIRSNLYCSGQNQSLSYQEELKTGSRQQHICTGMFWMSGAEAGTVHAVPNRSGLGC